MSTPLAIDLFCGLGGWTEGLLAEGYNVVGFDIERHEYGEHRYPAQLVIQDVLTLHGAQFRGATLIVASPPCFVAQTLILTARGLLPISEVVSGDFVLTHLNRWRRVLRTGTATAPTIIASGYGSVLEGTREHPIFARRDFGSFRIRTAGEKWPIYQPKSLGDPEWISLAEMEGVHWASPVIFDPLPVPKLPNALPDTADFWWMVGRWIGDGWLRRRGGGDEVMICCGHSEADGLEERLARVAPRVGKRAGVSELHWRRSSERTTTRFTAASNELAAWLATHFGRGATMKGWPAWALGMDRVCRQSLLDGYVSADGNPTLNGKTPVIKTTTVSKRLAIGTRFLAASLGCASTVKRQPRPPTCEIEGRVVNQMDSWDTRWTPGSDHNRLVEVAHGMQWGLVRKVNLGQASAQIWNLEVEEDNSYVADGIVVHNCQAYSYRAMPWSRAKALPPPDNTLFEACFRIQREACAAVGRHIPMVVENVRGAQKWVGRARWNFGSYYLWGDVPALMPVTFKGSKVPGFRFDGSGKSFQTASVERGETAAIPSEGYKNNGGSWFAVGGPGQKVTGQNPVSGRQAMDGVKGVGPTRDKEAGHAAHGMARWTNPAEGRKGAGAGAEWFDNNLCQLPSASPRRKLASALIAKIPLPLSTWIGRTYYPGQFP